MRVLTVWHKLLICFLNRKNDIIEGLTGITYTNNEDIKEIKTWSKADVKKVLDHLHSNTSGSDAGSCPWCIINDNRCSVCSYGTRNSVCTSSKSPYRKIVNYMETSDLRDGSGICTNPDIESLIVEFTKINKLLPEIL